MDAQTIAAYEASAAAWRDAHDQVDGSPGLRLAHWVAGDGGAWVRAIDLGCGPGWFTTALGLQAIALDASRAMLALASDEAPHAPRVLADVEHLPFRDGSLGAALASKVHVHLPRADVPLALAELHRALAPGSPVGLHLFGGDREFDPVADDRFGPRRFSEWSAPQLGDVLEGAGYGIDWWDTVDGEDGHGEFVIGARRLRTLPDTVGPGMRLLMCGLNPSLHAADAGVGFQTANNRFWPAARLAGVTTVDRDPRRSLRADRVGMTDLVKRATPRASELSRDEYRSGLGRVERLCAWLRPAAVCFVGLAGWRAAVDRKARPGVQDTELGGRPVYVMPSTSGLNAGTSLDQLVEHLRSAASLADEAAASA